MVLPQAIGVHNSLIMNPGASGVGSLHPSGKDMLVQSVLAIPRRLTNPSVAMVLLDQDHELARADIAHEACRECDRGMGNTCGEKHDNGPRENPSKT